MLGQIDLKGEALSLDHTFECGQIFRWKKAGGWWLGTVERRPAMLRVEDRTLLFRSNGDLGKEALSRFLSLEVRYDELVRARGLDDFSLSLLRNYRGLRILRQDPWECLVAYIVSANLSIKAIETVLDGIASGKREVKLGERSIRPFPNPAEFLSIGRPRSGYLGRKWAYLRKAAGGVLNGKPDFDGLRVATYEEAWRLLATAKEGHLLGVGPKVADCVLLFSLEKPEAFPMDRWIMRGLLRHYGWLLPEKDVRGLMEGREALTHEEYARISGSVRSYFGDLGGLVQECLFLHMRAGSRLPSA